MVVLIVSFGAHGQSFRAANWAFPSANGFNFNSGSISQFTTSVPGGLFSQSTSAISDSSGALVLYSNGEQAWNASNTIIQGGNSLMGNKEATQSSIIIPDILNSDRYHLFTVDHNAGPNGLYHHVVDMFLNSGNGMVLPGQQLDSFMTEKICATRTANDHGYWVVAHKWDSDTFYSYKIDSFGFNSTPVVSKTGIVHQGSINGAMGQMKISPDGTKLAIAGWNGHIELFSFNNATGEVSNPLMLENFLSNKPFGVEFSPDSRKLFYMQRFSASPEARLYQYDLDHIDTACLLDSKIEIGFMNELKVPGGLQLGTDGKIYIGCNYIPSYDTLGVINNPNLYGAAVGFEEHGLHVNGTVTEGLCSFSSSFVGDGIHVVFGTTCEGMATAFFPEDSLNIDSLEWDFGDPASGSNNTSTDLDATHVFSGADTFTVTLVAHRGLSSDTLERNVIIWDIAEDLLGADTTICNGGANVVLDATWGNACIEWFDGSTNATKTINTAGTYWVDVNYQSCYFRDSIEVLGVNGPPVVDLGPDTSVCSNTSFVIDPDLPFAYYTWQDGSHDTTFTVTTTGVYSLSASNACGSNVDSLIVTVNTAAQPILNFPTDTTICDTGTLVLDVTFEDAVYVWNDGSTSATKTIDSAGTYSVTVGNICDTVSDTITVLFESPISDFLADGALLCGPNDSLVLGDQNDEIVLWSTGSLGEEITVQTAGVYFYVFQNSCGAFSDSTEVQVHDTSFALDLGPDQQVCSINEEVALGPDSALFMTSYSWSNGASTPSITAEVGVHQLTVENRCITLTDEVEVSLSTTVRIDSLLETTVCDGEELLLTFDGAAASSHQWSDGTTGSELVVTTAGTYLLEGIDTNGCAFSDSVVVNDDCPLTIFASNVFTPNADGINDGFCITHSNIASIHLSVFNRWGALVYHSTSLDDCWDGFIQEQPAAQGAYFYIIEAIGNDGQAQTFRGGFSLLR